QSGGERSYYVRGRLVCGIQGAQGARVSLWENRGGGQPDVHDEDVIDASGTVSLKAEIRGSSGGGFGNGNLMMTIMHNCDGNRQLTIALPPSYYNQGIVAIKTFDLGTINLEARYSEESSGFNGGGRGAGFGSGGRLGGFGQFAGLPQPIQ
ncbi:Transthyretin-like family protein, partial [Ostertagia ostertagi]